MCYFLQSADGSSNLQVKIVFVCACVTIVILSNAVISSQWMIPYIYAGLAPVLFSIRIVTFWYVAYNLPYITLCIWTDTNQTTKQLHLAIREKSDTVI